MWNAMCNAKMSLPSSIDQADLSKPFVYDRSYGVFFVPSGSHQVAMSLLLAWKNQEKNGVRVAEKLGLSYRGAATIRTEFIKSDTKAMNIIRNYVQKF